MKQKRVTKKLYAIQHGNVTMSSLQEERGVRNPLSEYDVEGADKDMLIDS